MNNAQSSIIGGKSGGKRRVLFGKGVLSLPLRQFFQEKKLADVGASGSDAAIFAKQK